jgi:hypothetical protein
MTHGTQLLNAREREVADFIMWWWHDAREKVGIEKSNVKIK